MKMTQGNFEVMKANQEVSRERHEASIKNLENQMGQLARQVSSLQTQSGFCGNTTDPRNESCNSISLRSREVSSQKVVENPKKDESKNGVVEKMRDGVVENRRENKKEEKNKEEKAYEGEVEKRVESESSAKKGKKPLVKDPKFQVPSPYARMPYPRMKRVKNQDLEFCGVVSECFKVEVLEEVVKDGKEEEWDHEIEIFLQNLDNPLEENDDLGWDLDGVVPIYYLYKVAKEEEPNPVVNPQKSSTSTLKASVKKVSKKSPSRSSKKERTNLKAKWEGLKNTLILAMKMTQGNFEVMKANQEVSRERHEASIKNLENQMGQLARQVSSLQTQSGFCGNTTDPRNESCNSISLRSREVSSQKVVENPKKDESKNGVVEKMRDGVVENRRENKKEEKNKEEKAYEDTLILAMKMTQGNFEVMKANQEVSRERHEASIKNLENQMGQLARQVSSLQTQSGFCGNTTDPRNESCNSISLRSREVSSQKVVENPKKDESKNGVVEKMRDGVVENRRENKKEEKNKEEKAYEVIYRRHPNIRSNNYGPCSMYRLFVACLRLILLVKSSTNNDVAEDSCVVEVAA
ncbi:unnamed protein product [Trifolium pratense]|uniref:Uncharacterized protein n=1 Tax=Trifolium pratense TaxID=57577 RepID=A0ACB0LCV8_TRIPR|nr:unnamed protein product [Trifolium pratense]